ncbi:hypothetical protein SteCoe_20679 [Stentor coeruleus]|uniref:CCT domain-containing protein n=1 Tax=Stentor coeruleus TaxID=5963 RepID=A0A1R2BRH2_9CILI|nr:hypothetical protein SteCoe_20679 [Stentor coeruleus]
MFNNNYIQEGFEGYEPPFLPSELPNFMIPGFDSYNTELFQRDFQTFPILNDFEGMDTTNFMQIFDQAFQNLPDEVKQWMPMPFDPTIPPVEGNEQQSLRVLAKPSLNYSNNKIGTISVEERRIKVQKFLEKRKRRNFKKKISYMCRKKVADQRVRVKGRFVSKVQAEALLGEKK